MAVPRGKMCALSTFQVIVMVLTILMAVLAVAMLAGGYRALLNYTLHQVRFTHYV